MASSIVVKKPCIKCSKGSGGVATCDGCQQSFCIKHIVEHREELATQMENIGQEHDILRRDLIQDNLMHPLLINIDEWEQESITRIQVTAEAARADLRQLIDKMKNNLKILLDKMNNEMQSCREVNDYTEVDLLRWTEELKELRKLSEKQLVVEIIEDDNRSSSISMIKICEQKPLQRSIMVDDTNACQQILPQSGIINLTYDRFRNFVGRVALYEDGLLATCLGAYWDGSNVYGTRLYSSGQHVIHFRIENKGSNNLFFGIKTTSFDVPIHSLTSTYTYGWWEFDHAIESINGHRVHNDRNIRTGDEVTMVLDCDTRQIRFEHHRINMIAHLPIQLDKCPFPWKILVTLRSTGDSVRILL